MEKIIHYCWFGRNKLSQHALDVIETWKKYAPGYEIKCWNEDNFNMENVKEELADVINYCIQMASILNVDIKEIVLNKLKKTELKYPVEKCKGISTKYNKL